LAVDAKELVQLEEHSKKLKEGKITADFKSRKSTTMKEEKLTPDQIDGKIKELQAQVRKSCTDAQENFAGKVNVVFHS